MIEILKSFIDLSFQFFNKIFSLQVELTEGFSISIGIIIVAIVFFFGSIILIFRAVGILSDRSDD